MSIVISAIGVFILLSLSAILAFKVPLESKSNVCNEEIVEPDSVLAKIVEASKNVPPIVTYLD